MKFYTPLGDILSSTIKPKKMKAKYYARLLEEIWNLNTIAACIAREMANKQNDEYLERFARAIEEQAATSYELKDWFKTVFKD